MSPPPPNAGDCDPTEIPMEDDTVVVVVGVAHEDCESAPTLRALLLPLAADTEDATVADRRAAAFTMHGDAIVYHNTVLQPGHTTFNLLQPSIVVSCIYNPLREFE